MTFTCFSWIRTGILNFDQTEKNSLEFCFESPSFSENNLYMQSGKIFFQNGQKLKYLEINDKIGLFFISEFPKMPKNVFSDLKIGYFLKHHGIKLKKKIFHTLLMNILNPERLFDCNNVTFRKNIV